MLIHGAHIRNELVIPDDDILRFKLARFRGLVMMWYSDPSLVERFGVDPANCVVRLPDSVYKSWPNNQDWIPHWAYYAKDCANIIERFYHRGYRKFQIDNEPNLTWPKIGKSAWDWAWFMDLALFNESEGVLSLLAQKGIHDIELGFTPMSHPDLNTVWLRAAQAKGLIERCQWIAAHCYWQAYGDMFSEQFGTNFSWLHNRPEMAQKPIIITECGNSSWQGHGPDLDLIRLKQAKEYPEYIQWVARYPFVQGAYFFILGYANYSDSWKGFDLTEDICLNIGCSTRR